MSTRAIPLYNPTTYHGEYGPYIDANRHRHDDPDLGEHTHQPQRHEGHKRGCQGCGALCAFDGCSICEAGLLCTRCQKKKEANS